MSTLRPSSIRFSRRRAFSLIECVAAIVVLGLGIPPMLWAIRGALHRNVNPLLASQARWLATEKLEDIIADRHSTTRGWSYVASGNYAAESPVSGYPGFSRSVAITQTAVDLSSAGTGYKKITVTVSWTDGTATARSLSISTVLTDYST